MEWTAYNKYRTKHHITVSGDEELRVTIVRLRTAGGVPKVITRFYEPTIGFKETMTKINTIVNLDEELYNMVAESS